MEQLNSKNILEKYVDQCKQFLKNITLHSAFDRQKFTNKNIVFEGAQGLLLDEDHRFFPHVTHSHTGLDNVLELCAMLLLLAAMMRGRATYYQAKGRETMSRVTCGKYWPMNGT
jgi:hypothetical protein